MTRRLKDSLTIAFEIIDGIVTAKTGYIDFRLAL